MVTTLIRTAAGQTIVVKHDTDSPRPYSRDVNVQGTRGLVRKYPEEKIYVEGRSPEHRWEPLSSYDAEYEHPLWKAMQEQSRGAGHGGMDYIEDYRLIQCLRRGHAPRHGCLRRRGLERRIPPERALHRQPEPTGPFPRFHPRRMEKEAAPWASSPLEGTAQASCAPPGL